MERMVGKKKQRTTSNERLSEYKIILQTKKPNKFFKSEFNKIEDILFNEKSEKNEKK
jgi:hypothetical protein